MWSSYWTTKASEHWDFTLKIWPSHTQAAQLIETGVLYVSARFTCWGKSQKFGWWSNLTDQHNRAYVVYLFLFDMLLDEIRYTFWNKRKVASSSAMMVPSKKGSLQGSNAREKWQSQKELIPVAQEARQKPQHTNHHLKGDRN